MGAFWPMPEGEPMGSPAAGPFVRRRIEELSKGLDKPESTKKGLTLPTSEGPGVRLYLSLRAQGRAPLNYKAPTVEAVNTSDAERKALAYPDTTREVPAEELKRWLGQLFPAAIMDSSGKPPLVSGTLTLAPAGAGGGRRLALLKGTVAFQMDDRAATRYRGALEAVLTFGDGKDFSSLRGSFSGVYPKSDPRHERPLEFQMNAVLESFPD